MGKSKRMMKEMRIFLEESTQNVERYASNAGDFSRKGKLHFQKLSCMMCSLFKSQFRLS